MKTATSEGKSCVSLLPVVVMPMFLAYCVLVRNKTGTSFFKLLADLIRGIALAIQW